MTKISLQLWSIQEECAKDFLGTLTKVKEFGYDGVEFAGYYETEAAELKAHLDKIGLAVSGSHVPADKLVNDLENTIAYEKALGNQNVIIPWEQGETLADWQDHFAKFAEIQQRLQEEGLTLGYHNHAHEFTQVPEVNVLEAMVAAVPGIKLEVDTYWVEFAGEIAIKWMTRNQAAIKWLHIKEMRKDGNTTESTEISTGILPIRSFVEFAKENEIEWLVVEQEAFQAYPPIESAEINVQNLRKIVEEVF